LALACSPSLRGSASLAEIAAVSAWLPQLGASLRAQARGVEGVHAGLVHLLHFIDPGRPTQ